MWSSPLLCYLVPLRPKYPPQHSILEHLQLTFLPQCDRPSTITLKSSSSKNNNNNNNNMFWNARWIFCWGNESALRLRWQKNTAGRQHRRRGSHAAADQFPVHRSLHFNWTALYEHTKLTTCILSSNLRKTGLKTELPKRNCCVKSWSVCQLKASLRLAHTILDILNCQCTAQVTSLHAYRLQKSGHRSLQSLITYLLTYLLTPCSFLRS